MKHYLLSAIIMALCLVPSITHAYDFSAVNDDGVTIYYNIISEEEKTCGVTYGIDSEGFDVPYTGDIVIPSKANGYTITKILSGFENSDITSVTIPNTVTSIEPWSFDCCQKLSSIKIPNSVISIGEVAFAGCPELKTVIIGDGVKTIGERAFIMCTKLETLIIGKSLETIHNTAFEDCTSLSHLELNMPMVKEWFYTMESIETVTLGDNVNTIGVDAFCYTSLTSINIPNSVTVIGDNAFGGCKHLTSIEIPNSVTIIGNDAFQGCSALKSITIPASVTTIGDFAFENCTSLTSAKIGDSHVTSNCSTAINTGAFKGCTKLESVTLGNSVSSIGESDIEVNSRGAIFGGCTNLATITSHITELFVPVENAFDGCYDATLYVPRGMIDTYKATAEWEKFNTIEEMPSIPLSLSCNTKGSITINEISNFSNKIGIVYITENSDNTFTFTPKSGCKLDQVILNGLDITANVEGNTLTCTIPANSQMIVTFTTEQGDMNNDGTLDISDVVAIVNKILGN